MLEIEKISSGYGNLQVLWDVSMSVKEGKITVIIGPNGAGKTTLLRTIMHLIPTWSGKITFLGNDITNLTTEEIAKMNIGLVPEGRRVFRTLTVYENLLVSAQTQEAKSRFRENLAFVYKIFPVLKEREKQRAGTLSGGEQQMLAIARGLMNNPKLLMLDEPSQGLAPVVVRKIYSTIKELSKGGLTILIPEQRVKDGLELADYAYVLDKGKVVLEGTGRELLENPHVRKTYIGI